MTTLMMVIDKHKNMKKLKTVSLVGTPQSSQSPSNNRVHTPQPMHVSSGKWYRNTKYNRVEER